ncbi:hypothetical protein ACOSQ3_021905 [Xanthoceras sorbifolium]
MEEVKEYKSWFGIQQWSLNPLNENHFWGPNGPESPSQHSQLMPVITADNSMESASSLEELGALVLSTSDPLSKSKLFQLAFSICSLDLLNSNWFVQFLCVKVYNAANDQLITFVERPRGSPCPEILLPHLVWQVSQRLIKTL